MARLRYVGAILSLALFCLSCGPATPADRPSESSKYQAGTGELLLGRINFPTSASGKAQDEFITGVLALHSFWYEEARDHFRAAEQADPSFGLAYWGEAMSYDNALNTHPEQGSEERGTEVIEKMNQLDAAGSLRWSQRERQFANAVRKRFQRDVPLNQRRQAYVQAMASIAKQYPDDEEVVAFTAVALLATPGFDVNNPAHVLAVSSRLEQVYAVNPEHPGVLHYLIHVYDSPAFAPKGLKAAETYAKIAPASSHALHMPSHIFRHLGMWKEVAVSNTAAYKASVAWQKRTKRPVTARDFHALDWLMEADLRLGRGDAARGILKELDNVEKEIADRGENPAEFPQVAAALRKDYAAFAAAPEGAK
jgi:hypothetical protein